MNQKGLTAKTTVIHNVINSERVLIIKVKNENKQIFTKKARYSSLF